MGRKGKASDLGRALAKRKQRDREAARNSQNTASARQAAATGRHTLTYDERGKLQSVLDATDLEELMLNATMANEDFTAQRYPGPLAPQTVVVTPLRPNDALQGKEKEMRRELDRTALRIPRRPPWNASTTPAELLANEAEEFLKWRRRIASVEEENSMSSTIGGPMMTPFEKNLEVWRQLWRVVERSDVVVQIVDARNPLLYYCEDMYRYVTKDMGRAHLLMLNKADLLSEGMISRWQEYFKEEGLDVIFFSAFKASVNEETHDSRVVGVKDLIKRLHRCERRAPQTHDNQRIVVGMCGYPNVGKSSTINVLLEAVAEIEEEKEQGAHSELEKEQVVITNAKSGLHSDTTSESDTDRTEASSQTAPIIHGKRVAVSSTPGKTKHFQTLVLTEEVLLCDCPGLVFPNFSSSKSELICAGVLSIDQMRGDHLTPVSLIADRIPAPLFEGVYGLRFPALTDGVYADTDVLLRAAPGHVSATMLLDTHARARGFMSDHGAPDQSRSSRILLKDYVNGRIIFAHAPPPNEIGNGESGIGPAVHAKKGALVYKRQEAAESSIPSYVNRIDGKAGLSSTNGAQLGELEGRQQRAVKARVAGSKKYPHREFTRVERSYYPQV